jgi:hypothetical protein
MEFNVFLYPRFPNGLLEKKSMFSNPFILFLILIIHFSFMFLGFSYLTFQATSHVACVALDLYELQWYVASPYNLQLKSQRSSL